ncbi:HNH endonuclease [Janthinobacterium lividum]|nr:HNH endonuclease [Janthinobacterium lividum]
MIEIALSNGGLAKVDDKDFLKISHLTWFKSNKGYAIASTHVDGAIVNLYMHRVILGLENDLIGDHRNGDRLDNTRANLRSCTYSQNNMNARKRGGCTSIQKGVYWCKQKSKWHARIKLDGKARHLGFFSDEVDAGKAYNAAAAALFGPFAKLNNF